jgi:hypothetical protein
MTRKPEGERSDTATIACQQVLLRDASVFSIQWLLLPARHEASLQPVRLIERYLVHVRRATLSLIRPVESAAGIEFRLVGTRMSLLTFAPLLDTSAAPRLAATLRICGGVLVQPRQCHRGQFAFSSEPCEGGIRVTVELSDYCPLLLGSPAPSLLHKLLYRLTQAHIHKVVMVNFLARIYRELEGEKTPVRVVRVEVAEGERL